MYALRGTTLLNSLILYELAVPHQYCLAETARRDNFASFGGSHMIDGLAGVKNSAGTIVFVCSKCRTYPDHAYGAPNKDQLVYMLVCQKCSRTLGEWVSTEQREKELREFAKRVELLT
jgi:hypothetical protein